jgi:hypothetical protein
VLKMGQDVQKRFRNSDLLSWNIRDMFNVGHSLNSN